MEYCEKGGVPGSFQLACWLNLCWQVLCCHIGLLRKARGVVTQHRAALSCLYSQCGLGVATC
jgi:hypothetical protein